ncbi:gastrula zinc finger protein XlCGF8.2DB [Galendromus occidentalis]|uniref:Gastrula zinc finger protein XlCGF8.2DB n=1 Tax=Galendromus occidentalis TaxID=34638 RepID=A0AAJ7SDZ9_9ACAR|nr:gastrula zinc finger protein XlCGF8.2DB [Galendromus occidentalis]
MARFRSVTRTPVLLTWLKTTPGSPTGPLTQVQVRATVTTKPSVVVARTPPSAPQAIAQIESDEENPSLAEERRQDFAKSFQRDANGKFNCAFCPYSTEHHGSMKNHQMTHTGEKPYECGTCGKKFIQKGNWRRHELRVHSSSSANKTYQCPQCPESFAELHLMTAHHITAHLSPQGLLANGAFKKDMLSILDATLGTKRKDKTCEVCLKQFASRHDMERHMRVHTREKPFVCPLCSTGFTQKSSLKSHLYTVHNLTQNM